MPAPFTSFLIAIVCGYLLGSIPFGLLVGLAKGVDPRLQGSKNIGATNVGRLLGGKFFALVFTLDLLKGLLPMIFAGMLASRESKPTAIIYVLWLGVGVAAILGHMFSLYIGFKGGKGVATSFGVVLGLWPYYVLPAAIAAVVFLIVFNATRYVSLGSILATASFPVTYIVLAEYWHWDPTGRQLPLLIFALLIPAMIIYKHRTNIVRLRAGTENKFARKAH